MTSAAEEEYVLERSPLGSSRFAQILRLHLYKYTLTDIVSTSSIGFGKD